MFVRVPKNLLEYSYSCDRFVLPIYLYCGFAANQFNDFVVSTNIMLMVDTFNPNEDNRKGYNSKYIEALQTLTTGVPNKFSECLYFKCPPSITDPNDFMNFQQNMIKNINKTSKLELYFANREMQINNQFTKVEAEEYFHLINSVNLINNYVPYKKNDYSYTEFVPNKKKWNLIDLINFYVYLKSRISFFEIQKTESKNLGSMRETTSSMGTKFGVGSKTITKYVNQLKELKMIKTNTSIINKHRVIQYFLDDSWRETNEE